MARKLDWTRAKTYGPLIPSDEIGARAAANDLALIEKKPRTKKQRHGAEARRAYAMMTACSEEEKARASRTGRKDSN